MSRQSENAPGAGRRWLAVAALAAPTLVALAVVWGGLVSASAQDQTKWWGGAAAIDARRCAGIIRDKFIQEVQQDNTRLQNAESGCYVHLGGGPEPRDTSLMAVGSMDYAARAEGNRVWLRVSSQKICQGAAQGPGCSGSVYKRGWNKLSCTDAAAIAGDALRAIDAPFGAADIVCSYHEGAAYGDGKVSAQYIDIIFRPGPARALAQTCSATSLFGDWKSDAPAHIKKGLTLKLKPQQDRATWLGGKFVAQSKYQHEVGVGLSPVGVWGFADPVKAGDNCVFRIKTSPLASAGGWTLRYNAKSDSFSFFNGSDSAATPDRLLPGRWTRGSPPKPAATCGKDDVNGTWHRADGARILMTGVGVFGAGGHAIMERYPDDRWPKGELKFRGVKEVSQCRYEASCTTINRRTTNGVASYGVTQEACTLTLDPVKRTLSATGGSGLFSRQAAPQTTTSSPTAATRAEAARKEADAAAARKDAEAKAEAARTAALNAEITRRNAEVERRNAAAAAADARRQAEYRAALAAQRAEAARIKRQQAEAQRKYEADMAAWRARVAACQAGDKTQCGP